MYKEQRVISIQQHFHHSSSKIISFISGKSNNSDNVIPNPVAILCNV